MDDFKITASIDLTSEVCPITFVKSKLKLEGMEKGEILQIKLKKGSAVENVPRSFKMEGHKVLKVKKDETGEVFTFIVEKGE